jgi:F-type H+-transporting ATPase subunit gamma
MSKRREVDARIGALAEIHSIMTSMKNLAMIETRRLARFHDTQQRVVDSIGLALNEVRRHYLPEELPADSLAPVYLVLGSERGFCGAYNEQLLDLLERQPGLPQAPVIGVGTRLAGPLERRYPHAVCVPGAAVADEVEAALSAIAQAIAGLRGSRAAFSLQVVYCQPDNRGPVCLPVLPALEPGPARGLPPMLNVAPAPLLGELLEHYLFAVTNAWLFAALMAENQRRVQHLEQAGQHLEREVDALGKRRNVLRQEEIIEEIEVILLSAGLVGMPGAERPAAP